jgi:hypothetical protein
MQQLAERRGRLDREFLNIALLSLEQQLDFLASHLEVDIGGNHLVRNIRALLWASRFFSGAAAARWQQLGAALLAQELDEQILRTAFISRSALPITSRCSRTCSTATRWLPPGALRDRLAGELHAMAQVARRHDAPDGFRQPLQRRLVPHGVCAVGMPRVYNQLFSRP